MKENRIICASTESNWTEYSKGDYRILFLSDKRIDIYHANWSAFRYWIHILGRKYQDLQPISKEQEEFINKLFKKSLIYYSDERDEMFSNVEQFYPTIVESNKPLILRLISSYSFLSRLNSSEKKIFSQIYNPREFNRLFTPRRISLDLLYDCNLSCSHCYVQGSTPPFSMNRFNSIILELKKAHIKKISLLGGEPFLLPQIKEVVEQCYQHGFEVDINTNGTIIDKSLYPVLKKTDTMLVISLDGVTFRTKWAYDKAVRTIRECIAEEIKIRISFTACRNNYHEFLKVFFFAIQLGVSHFYLRTYSNMGEDYSLRFYQWHLLKIYRTLGQLLIKLNLVKIKFGHTLSYGKCFARSTFNLGIDGSVRYCSLFHKDYSLGNIFSRRIIDIWNSDEYQHHIDASNIEGLCNECLLNKTCPQICRAESYIRTGNFYAAKKYCWKGRLLISMRRIFSWILSGRE